MNKTKFMQTDSRWGGLGYPKKPYYLRNCGCGEVSIANILIEMEAYKNITPATIQPYCKQFADPRGNGTYWSGIPAMMKHYGLTEVQEHATMDTLWKELAKGGRVAIYLMGSKPAGTKKIHWTSGGHFISSVSYRYRDGDHQVYVKDSYSNSASRNGWLGYKTHLRGDVLKVWSGKLKTTNKAKTETKPYTPSTPYTGGLPQYTVKKGTRGTDVKHVQKFLNWCIGSKLDVDGVCGGLTDKAIRKYQKQYGLKVDGIFGSQSKKKAEAIIKAHAPVPAPKPTPTPAKTDPLQAWFDAMKTQFNWSKNQRYEWNDNPTVATSKKEGTCITFPAVSLQRIGLLPKGGYFYFHPKHKRISGESASYVKKHKDIFALSYPNKTLKQLRKEGKIRKGDIIGYGNPAYHTMVYMGTDKDGNSIFNTMGHKKGLSVNYSSYAKRKVNMLVRIKKLK
jgi:peptidoglycan hydrolase-like protein with peptidoglycan-binding domain